MKANGEPDLRVVGECTLDADDQLSLGGRSRQVGSRTTHACVPYGAQCFPLQGLCIGLDSRELTALVPSSIFGSSTGSAKVVAFGM